MPNTKLTPAERHAKHLEERAEMEKALAGKTFQQMNGHELAQAAAFAFEDIEDAKAEMEKDPSQSALSALLKATAELTQINHTRASR